jgi:hypothetical protein
LGLVPAVQTPENHQELISQRIVGKNIPCTKLFGDNHHFVKLANISFVVEKEIVIYVSDFSGWSRRPGGSQDLSHCLARQSLTCQHLDPTLVPGNAAA